MAPLARPAEPACVLALLLLCAVAAGAAGPDSPIWQAYDRAQRFGSSQLDSLVRNARVEANWSDDGNSFWYRRQTADGAEFIRIDALTGAREPAFDHAALADALSAASGQTYLPERLPFRRFDLEQGKLRFAVGSREWLFDPIAGTCAEPEPPGVFGPPRATEEPPAEEPEGEGRGRRLVSPDGVWTVVPDEHNLKLRDAADHETPLTTDGADDGYYTFRGWAPDSSTLVIAKTVPGDRLDMFTVESAPSEGVRPVLHRYRYDLPGDRLDVTTLFVYPLERRELLPVDHPPIDWWASNQPHWLPDGHTFCYDQTDRGFQRRRLFAVDARTGATRVVVDEQTNTFLPPDKGWYRFIGDGRELLWMSERDGWCHLYRYDTATGEVLNQVTQGEWVVRGVEEVDEEAGTLRFTGSGREPGDPYLLHHYRVNLDGSGFTPLTAGEGQHRLQFSPDRRFYLDVYSRVDLAPVTELRRTSDGALICAVEQADAADLLATGWRWPEPFVAKGRDGVTDIWGVIYRPTTLDETQRYPVIENIYAGPQGNFAPKTFGVAGELQATAELGFIVVMIDGMGTSGRSKAFHDVAWHNLGDSGFPDRIAWLQAAAAKYPYLDLSRVGIWGHSAGGYNAARALIAHPEFYTVAVAQAGNHDHRTDKVWWNELWMGYPVGPHYEEQSNIVNADKLEGHLLLIHGELDDNVNPSASTLQFANALIAADKDFDLLILPGNGHGFRGTYATRRRWNHFVEHLLGVDPPAGYRLGGVAGSECEIIIRNRLAEAVGIYWISGDGQARKYHDLAAGAEIRQHTYYGHEWEARIGERPVSWFSAAPNGTEWEVGAP